jgi:FMN phosphatase YigB (HAD superfamily)
MKKYSTLIFDLFDTIVNFNFKHLPYVDKNGIRSRTTGKEVFTVFEDYYPNYSFDEFYPHFIDSYHLFQEMKKKEFREFPNRERFKLMLGNMGIAPDENTSTLENNMVEAHMNGLMSCVELPEANKKTLFLANAKGYRMAIVSNFDYAPTARALIGKLGIGELFESIVISEDVGWRKPKDIIFKKSLSELGTDPGDALFIGDNFEADIKGSRGVGMDSVWINRKHEPEKNLVPEPAYIIRTLHEISAFI